MGKITNAISSSKTSLVLLFIFAAACAWGTFAENDYGTPAARTLVYDAWWFETVMFLLMVNFSFHIVKYRLYRKEKISVFMFHLGFVIVLLGAFVSRYSGFEGLVNIREGQRATSMTANTMYLALETDTLNQVEKIVPSQFQVPSFSYADPAGKWKIECTDYIPNAVQKIDKGEKTIIEMVVALDGQRSTFFLEHGKRLELPMTDIGFGVEAEGVQLEDREGGVWITTNAPAEFMHMPSQEGGSFPADSASKLRTLTLYRVGALSFVVRDVFRNAERVFATSENKKEWKNLTDKLVFELLSADKTETLYLDYIPYSQSVVSALAGDQLVRLYTYPKRVSFGFELELTDFELIRYPGSTSPSSYSSYLNVLDGEEKFPYVIYMNNVLDHKGFRFFQASYDNDEKGTVLSVNHDWWGTQITYLGYFMLMLGMAWSLFGKNTRFRLVNKRLQKLRSQSTAIFLLLLLPVGLMANSAQAPVETGIPIKRVGSAFGELWVQDMDGRVKPVNTLASELCRKITGKSKFELRYDSSSYTLTPDQLIIALHAAPRFWSKAPFIKVDAKKGKPIRDKLGKGDESYLSLVDFFDKEGNYLLQDMVDEAHNTKPDQRDVVMDEVLKVDERFNIVYQALTSSYLKMFPDAKDDNHSWYSDRDLLMHMPSDDSLFVKSILPLFYQEGLYDQAKAEEYVGYIKLYQKRYGGDILPSDNQLKVELLYNKLKLFLHLFYSYFIAGIALLVIVIIRMFSTSPLLRWLKSAFVGLGWILFALQTFNMILRWYAGDHAPWSNGYEMTLLVAWASVFFALILQRKSDFVLPLAMLFSGVLLFVGYLDWLNPEITNLVPVLKSYWLKIHVAIIVGSYAPLALSALLGLTSLWILITGKKENKPLQRAFMECSNLNELSMTIGLYMLTIGTFLGGVWANESWGRYWGWDPKETWALISILVYALILHMRFIPGIRPFYYWFNAASVIGFLSIIMTSFGVNYYLSGLHSYAQGDPVPIPQWVYFLLAFLALTVITGFIKRSWLVNRNP